MFAGRQHAAGSVGAPGRARGGGRRPLSFVGQQRWARRSPCARTAFCVEL